MNADPPPPLQPYYSVPFRPDGGVPVGGLFLTLLLCGAGALVIGAVVSAVHQWVYLVLVFPLAMGAGTGAAGYIGVRSGKVRNPWVAGGVGLAAGVFVMLCTYYCDYLLALLDLAR